mgnify:CR=1 FL=1
MRTVEQLIAENISRTEMTYEEEVAFVNYWYDKYEKEGFCNTFLSPYMQYKRYNGQGFDVLKRVSIDGDANLVFDLECLPVWNIRFAGGFETFAYPEEICLAERKD